jgi:hypothetical protein
MEIFKTFNVSMQISSPERSNLYSHLEACGFLTAKAQRRKVLLSITYFLHKIDCAPNQQSNILSGTLRPCASAVKYLDGRMPILY